jgi:hypothetical protein
MSGVHVHSLLVIFKKREQVLKGTSQSMVGTTEQWNMSSGIFQREFNNRLER